MDEAFTLYDQDSNIVDVNDTACRLVGPARIELIGAKHWQQFPGAYDSELGRMYRQISLDGTPRFFEHRYVFADDHGASLDRPYWVASCPSRSR